MMLFTYVLLISIPLATSLDDINKDSKPTCDEFASCIQKINWPNLFRPTDLSFETALKNYTRNRRYTTPTTPKPLAIFRPTSESQIKTAISCCQKTGLQMRIRSGGHDYNGLSYVSQVPFIILDMSELRQIDVNVQDETATAQAGASVGELYYKIANESDVLAFPAGVCPTLGLGGHISGGGYGNLMRKYGLSVDNVIDAKIMTADGEIRDRKGMGEDLFWAIRGGGGASFGVILSWTFKLVRVPETVTVFKVPKNVETDNSTNLVMKYFDHADRLVGDLFIRLQIEPVNSTINPGRKSVNTTFVGLYLGNSTRLLYILSHVFPGLGVKQCDLKEMKWVNSTLFWVGFPQGTPIEALLDKIPKWPPSFLARKSDYIKKAIPREGWEAIWKAVIKTEVSMQWNPYGAKMEEIPESEIAFPHRAGDRYLIQYTANWAEQILTETYTKRMREVYEFMTPYVTSNPREAFLNYRDLDIGSIGCNGTGSFQEASVYGSKIFKNNFQRLVKIKTAVDPQNFFRYEQSIPVEPIGRK